MRKLLIAIAAFFAISQAKAQDVEVSAYDVDSTYILNALHNPNDYAQAPTTLPQRKVQDAKRISTNVTMGTSFGSMGSSQYVAPTVNYQASDRLKLSFGMGMAFSNLNLRSFEKEASETRNMNVRALTNYYSVSASYQVSPRCTMYGSVIYAKNMFDKESPVNPYWSKDRYMATFGAQFNITESLSIGFEVRKAKNMGAYYGFETPMYPYGF